MDRQNLFFVEYGSGFPMVFLHGYPLNHSIWLDIVPFLESGARLILSDLRGHGQSYVPAGVYRMQDFAEDINHLLRELGVEKVIMVGHSLGGYIALKFIRMFPDRVAGLALVATRAESEPLEKKIERYQTAERMLKEGLDSILQTMPGRLTPNLALHEKIQKIMSETKPLGVANTLKGIAEREDAIPWLLNINVPTVVVAGELDEIIPVQRAQQMAYQIPNCEFILAKGCGHMPMMESPQLVAEALRGLISRCK